MITYEHQLTLSARPVASGWVCICISISGQVPAFVECKQHQSRQLIQQLERAYDVMCNQGGGPTPADLKALVTRPKPIL